MKFLLPFFLSLFFCVHHANGSILNRSMLKIKVLFETGESVSFEDVQGFYRGHCYYWEEWRIKSAETLTGLYRETLRPFVLAEGSHEKQIMNVRLHSTNNFNLTSEKEAKRLTYKHSSYPLSDDLDNPFKTLFYDDSYRDVVFFIRKKEGALVSIAVRDFSPETPYEDYKITDACRYPVKL